MIRSADEMSGRSVAIVGGGPIGIEAALEAKRRGFDVTVYDGEMYAQCSTCRVVYSVEPL